MTFLLSGKNVGLLVIGYLHPERLTHSDRSYDQAMHRAGEEWQLSVAAVSTLRVAGRSSSSHPRSRDRPRPCPGGWRPTDPHGAARSLQPAPILQPARARHPPPASSLLIHFPGEEANEGTWSPAPARTSQETLWDEYRIQCDEDPQHF